MYKRTDLSVSDGQNNWQTSVNNMKFVNWHLVVLSNDYKLPIFWAYHDMLWKMSCFVSLFSSRDFIITVMYRILIDESRTAVYDEVCISIFRFLVKPCGIKIYGIIISFDCLLIHYHWPTNIWNGCVCSRLCLITISYGSIWSSCMRKNRQPDIFV